MNLQESTTVRLLALWMERQGVKNASEAAKRLGVTRAAVSGWKLGKSHAEPCAVSQMAKELGIDELGTLAAVEADRATKASNQRVWRRHGKGVFMALTVGLALPLLLGPGTARSASLAPPTTLPGDVSPHYAKWRRRRTRRPWAGLRAAWFRRGA